MGNIEKKKKIVDEINLIYDETELIAIKIFGSEFVENNKDKCKIIVEGEEYELSTTYYFKNEHKKELKIK